MQRAEDALRRHDEALLQAGRQAFSIYLLNAMACLVLAVPLHFAGSDRRLSFRQSAEVEFARRQHGQSLIAEHAHINFAPGNVVLH